ncbi:MAG: hypothetical protein ABFD25_18285 [Clostridiaceae bacterium]
MLQFILSFLPMLAVITAVFMLVHKIKRSGICMGQMLCGFDFDWSISGSPAQVAFFMFSITVAIAVSLIAGAFTMVSGQLFLTLDIIFLLSSILLILFHQLKEDAPAFL